MSQKPFAAYQGVEPFVFVSYAHADDDVVFPELLQLHEAGYRLWYDEGISPGEEWPRSISQALITSKFVVVYLSRHALSSKCVQREIGLAVRREKELLPVYLEPLRLPDELEFQIGHVQAIDRYALSPEAYFQRVTSRLDKIPDINRRSREDFRDRIWRDLIDAARVQKSMLPQALPSITGYSFCARMEPFADGVGGDFYDFLTLPNGELLVLLSDVSGKGVSASVGMAALAGMITIAIEAFGADLVGMMKAVNRAYSRRMLQSESFATLIAVALDPATHRLRVVNAGSYPGLIRRLDGSIKNLVEESGLPLGISQDAEYVTVMTELGPGEAVFLASDGILDAIDSQNELYRAARLGNVLASTHGDASLLGETVLADVKDFRGSRMLPDDVTLVCFARDPR